MKRHPFDPLAAVAGAVFVALGVGFLTSGADVLDHAHWIWPVVLVALGGAGLFSALRREDRQEPEEGA